MSPKKSFGHGESRLFAHHLIVCTSRSVAGHRESDTDESKDAIVSTQQNCCINPVSDDTYPKFTCKFYIPKGSEGVKGSERTKRSEYSHSFRQQFF